VVASEVRKLAERSQQAASEINALSSSSVEIVEQAGQLLEDIVPKIQKTSELVKTISSTSTEQSASIDQINYALHQLDNVMASSAGSSEEVSSTAEALVNEARRLQEWVSFFQVQEAQPAYESDPEAPALVLAQ
jgi:methyl-accepting chemotaxis protein